MRPGPFRQIEPGEQDLIAYVTELEREVISARRYLETCRQVAGAEEHEMLLDALRRQRAESPGRAPPNDHRSDARRR